MATLWDKLLFWKKPKMKLFRENLDYKFIELPDNESTGIMLLMDKFDGVVYQYHQARVVPEGEMARLEFGYTILDSGNIDIDELQKDEEFVNIMGQLLSKILLDKESFDESFGANNPQKFDVQ